MGGGEREGGVERINGNGGIMTALVIYHANCYDGFTAAWIARQAMPDRRRARAGDARAARRGRGLLGAWAMTDN